MLHVEHLWMDGCEYSRRTPMVAWSAQSLYAILLWFTYIYMLHVRSSCANPASSKSKAGAFLCVFFRFFGSFLTWGDVDVMRALLCLNTIKLPCIILPRNVGTDKNCWMGTPQNIYPLYSIILKRNRIKFLQNDQIFSIFCSKLLSLKSL